MSVLSVCLLETTVYVLVKVGVSPCKGSSQAVVFFCCCKDENPNVLHTNWDWFRYYIVNMCLASNDNINKRITLHECFNFERQSWHEPGNLEVKNVSPYSLSTSYRRGSWLLIFSSFSCFCCFGFFCVCGNRLFNLQTKLINIMLQ